MSNALWVPMNDVAGEQATIAANKRWQSRLFTTSGPWTVPADVGVIWVDGCSGGGGGGAGYAGLGGGGGGGSATVCCRNQALPVTPSAVLTLTIAAGALGGVVGGANTQSPGATSIVSGSEVLLELNYGHVVGAQGSASAGGSGGHLNNDLNNGAQATKYGWTTLYSYQSSEFSQCSFSTGSPGGALNTKGSPGIAFANVTTKLYSPAATGNASGGGGGAGGSGAFGVGGNGGNGGVAGQNATGYGAGGGGGGGNAAGGNGSPGMIRIYCFSATTI